MIMEQSRQDQGKASFWAPLRVRRIVVQSWRYAKSFCGLVRILGIQARA
jgi:hypothetical protein